MTKPDLVREGEHGSWMRILNHESHVLHHGYYLTRLPADEKEMKLDTKESRLLEHKYLTGHQRWGKVDKNRLGTPKLGEKVSKGLSSMIEAV